MGVFVSLVSTRIPFKGAGKEYVADDVAELVGAVRAALQACGTQLRVRVTSLTHLARDKMQDEHDPHPHAAGLLPCMPLFCLPACPPAHVSDD